MQSKKLCSDLVVEGKGRLRREVDSFPEPEMKSHCLCPAGAKDVIISGWKECHESEEQRQAGNSIKRMNEVGKSQGEERQELIQGWNSIEHNTRQRRRRVRSLAK